MDTMSAKERFVIAYECYKIRRTSVIPKDWAELSRDEKKRALADADRIMTAVDAAEATT